MSASPSRCSIWRSAARKRDCLCSSPAGYRSYSEQAQNFTRVCNNNGVSDGKDSNGHYITMPAGCSEHQSGLACDITDVYREIKNSEIENTDTYKWLLEHCAEYGFIHRFPSGKVGRDRRHV